MERSPWARRWVRVVAACLGGAGVVGAGAWTGSRLAEPPPSIAVLDTVARAVASTTVDGTAPGTAPSGVAPTSSTAVVSTSSSPRPTTTTTLGSTGSTVVAADRLVKRGDCVDDRGRSEVRVPCEAPHTKEIVAVLDAVGLQRELGTTARPEPGTPSWIALDAYCDAQRATYLPRPLAPHGRFKSGKWLIVPEAWALDPGVECVIEEYQVTVAGGFGRVLRMGRLQTDLPVDQSLEVPAGACIDAVSDGFHYVACPGGNTTALGSVDWPPSGDVTAVQAACAALLPAGREADASRLIVAALSDADIAAGAHRTVCFVAPPS